MDEGKELEQERQRRAELEKELSVWHEKAIEKLSPEELAANVYEQQLRSLTYHLLKCRQRVSELEAELKAKEKEAEKAQETIESLEDEVEAKAAEAAESAEAEESPANQSAEHVEGPGQRIDAAVIVSDDDLDELLESVVSEPRKSALKPSKRSFRDFVRLLRRMERIKLFDAALLLDVKQVDVLRWAVKLRDKGYVTIEGGHDKLFVATDKMLRAR